MPIKTRPWNAPNEPDDGYRLLICRYRPRGVRKQDETWHGWCPDLGPTRQLHADFYGKNGDPIPFDEYVRRYLAEMQGEFQRDMIDELADLVREGKTVTLLCSSACTDETHCHRTLLRGLIEQRMQEKAACPAS